LDRVIEEKQDIKPTASKVKLEPAKEEEIEVVDILDAKTFKNLVELRNALQEKGIDVSQITNVKAAESVAKKNGYNYTVDKNA
jgi:tRNA U34 2-thiouridine synthase MnmA/TrmU